MPTVDSKGRVVLPKEVRERLGLTAGSEVEVREDGGRVVVEPEDDPAAIVSDLEALIERAAADRDAPDEELDALACDQRRGDSATDRGNPVRR